MSKRHKVAVADFVGGTVEHVLASSFGRGNKKLILMTSVSQNQPNSWFKIINTTTNEFFEVDNVQDAVTYYNAI